MIINLNLCLLRKSSNSFEYSNLFISLFCLFTINFEIASNMILKKDFIRLSFFIDPAQSAWATFTQFLSKQHQKENLKNPWNCLVIVFDIFTDFPIHENVVYEHTNETTQIWSCRTTKSNFILYARSRIYRCLSFWNWRFKGQLISKQNCGAVTSPKKWTKRTQNCIGSVFCSFFGSYGSTILFWNMYIRECVRNLDQRVQKVMS